MFCLPGYVADRLVQQDGHALLLGVVRGCAQRYLLRGIDLAAQFADDLAVDLNPAFFDVTICFAARTQAELRHAFGQADFFHGIIARNIMRGVI